MRILIKIIFSFLVLVALSINSYGEENLIAYWNFDDGDARDNSGNGYNGTLMYNPQLVPGYDSVGLAYHFQGYGVNEPLGSHILLPYIDFNKIPEFTVMLWAKFEGLSHEAGEAYLFFGDHERGWLGIMNHVRQPEYDGILFIQFAVGSNLYSGFQAIKPIEVKLKQGDMNKWIHYAMTFKDDTLKAYINGKLVGTKYQQVKVSGNKAAIARHWWAGDLSSTRYTGDIDEVKIYNRAFHGDEILSKCDETAFEYKDFSDASGIDFVDNVGQTSNTITLTPASYWKGGAIWHQGKVPVKKGFTSEFSFSFSDGEDDFYKEEYPGADGIAFVIQNHSDIAIGRKGGGIGFAGIPNSLAIEFDSFRNIESNDLINNRNNEIQSDDNNNDPNENHIGVFCNGTEPNLCDHKSSAHIGTAENIIPMIPDDRIFYSKIEYLEEDHTLSIWLDSTINYSNPVLILHNIDLSTMLNLEKDEFAWVGFTSATGNAFEKHKLLNWSFCPKPTSTILSVSENDFFDKQANDQLNIYPNPFENQLTISFNLNKREKVSLNIYDVLGNKVKTLVNVVRYAGYNNIAWNGTNDNNQIVNKGIYFYKLIIDNKFSSGTIIFK